VVVILEIKEGPAAARKIPLTPGRSFRVGRSIRADLALPDDQVMSNFHFALQCKDDRCRIRDLQSRKGTFVSDRKIAEAPPHDGGEIAAGQTRFSVSCEKAEGPMSLPSQCASIAPPQSVTPLPVAPSPQPRAGAPVLMPSKQSESPNVSATPQERLLAMLCGEFQPLYAILDAAVEPDVLKVLYESKQERQSLFDGEEGAQLAHFAPYLVRLTQESPLLEILVRQAWGKSWGVYLTCGLPLQDLRAHLRQFVTVRVPKGRQAYFRFYDPRILRAFLPTCRPAENKQFFGAVTHFLMEDETPDTLVRFSMTSNGLKRSTVALAPPKPTETELADTGSPTENAPSRSM